MTYFSNLLRSSGVRHVSAADLSERTSPSMSVEATPDLAVEELRIITPDHPTVIPAAAQTLSVPHLTVTAQPIELVDEPLGGVERLETASANVQQTSSKPEIDQEPRRASPDRLESLGQVCETASENLVIQESIQHPVYLADVRRWLAVAPLDSSHVVRETKAAEINIVDSPPRAVWRGDDQRSALAVEVRNPKLETEQPISNTAAEPVVENFTFSIGSIHVTVEEAATPPAGSPGAGPLVAPDHRDETRLSRHYLCF